MHYVPLCFLCIYMIISYIFILAYAQFRYYRQFFFGGFTQVFHSFCAD